MLNISKETIFLSIAIATIANFIPAKL